MEQVKGLCYKVVYRTKRGDLMSVWIRAKIVPNWVSFGKKRVSRLLLKSYSTEKWTEASPSMLKRGYGLCVFPNRDYANTFRANHNWMCRGRIEVWEAQVESIFRPPYHQLDLQPDRWGKFRVMSGAFPRGTVMCKRARLIRKVS